MSMCLATREGTDAAWPGLNLPALQQPFSDLTPPHLKLRGPLPLISHHNTDYLGHEVSASCSVDRPTRALGLGEKAVKSPCSVTLFGKLLMSKLHHAHGGDVLDSVDMQPVDSWEPPQAPQPPVLSYNTLPEPGDLHLRPPFLVQRMDHSRDHPFHALLPHPPACGLVFWDDLNVRAVAKDGKDSVGPTLRANMWCCQPLSSCHHEQDTAA